MKQKMAVLTASSLLCAGLATAQAPQTPVTPVAGMSVVGVAVVEMEMVLAGWSVQKDLLKKPIVNDAKDKIGTITDIIISPNPDAKKPAAGFAIVGVGGFLGMGKREVAIPMEQIKLQGTQLVLPGATKDALKALPAFEYKRK